MPEICVAVVPCVAHLLVFIFWQAPMPGAESVCAAMPAPPAILILGACQFRVPGVPFATLAANRWRRFWSVEEGDPILQGHRAQLFECRRLLHEHLYFRPVPKVASLLRVRSVSTQGALLLLLLLAVLRQVTSLFTAATPSWRRLPAAAADPQVWEVQNRLDRIPNTWGTRIHCWLGEW